MHLLYGAWWLNDKFRALRSEDSRFESHSSRCVATLDKLCTHNYYPVDMMSALSGCRVVKVDSCNNLLSSVHAMTVKDRWSKGVSDAQ